jgi:hypothetical protein
MVIRSTAIGQAVNRKMDHGPKTKCHSVRSCAVLVFLILSGCSRNYTDPYPPGWPSPAEAGAESCPDLTGRFEANSSSASSVPPRFLRTGVDGNLFDDISNEGTFGAHRCDSCVVEFVWTDDARHALHVRLLESTRTKEDRVIAEKRFSPQKGELECRAGKLVVPFTSVVEVGLGGNVDRGARTYWIGQNGTLIRELTYTSYRHHSVVLPVIAHVRNYRAWHRAGNPPE